MPARTAQSGVFCLIVLTVAAGCGGGQEGVQSVLQHSQVAISIAPASVTLAAGATQIFTATVSGTANMSVAWSLIEGTAAGAISSDGVYIAPTKGSTYHVVATAMAEPTKSATATIVVTTRAQAPIISVTLSPKTAQTHVGGKLQFAASVAGTADTRVSWSIAEGATGGSIDAAGAYTAPAAPGTFHVVAASVVNPPSTDIATISVTKPACVPTTCAAQKACGTIPDGCGGTLDCDACATGICGDPSVPHHSLTGCGEISAPGCYTLAADVQPSGDGRCLWLHDAAGVELDCAGHSIAGTPAIQASKLANFHIHGCRLTSAPLFGMTLSGSSDGTLDANDFRGGISSRDSARITIASNTIENEVEQWYGTNMVVRDNAFTLPPNPSTMTAGFVFALYGSGTQVLRNTMKGGWNGHDQAGIDDAIILWDEHGDIVDGNSIADTYDCGIETLGLIADTVISNNNIHHSFACGIGGWYWSSWRGNRISGNAVDDTLQLFDLSRFGGLRPAGFDPEGRMPADTVVEFHDNVFERNTFANPTSNLPSSSIPLYSGMLYRSSTAPFQQVAGTRDPGPNDWNLSHNTFTANGFGSATPAPSFGNKEVPGAVVDGGGNLCGAPQTTPYPLACGR